MAPHEGWGDAMPPQVTEPSGGYHGGYSQGQGSSNGQRANRGGWREGGYGSNNGFAGRGRKPWSKDRKDGDWNDGPRQPRLVHQPLGLDQIARLLLAHMEFMEELANEDLDALVSQPAPHGLLFAWVESQYQEHGAQSWAVLQSRLGDTPQAQLARTLMEGPHGQPEGELPELRRELRSAINPILVKRLKELEDQALTEVATDPLAVQRYRALQERRKQLSAPPPPPA